MNTSIITKPLTKFVSENSSAILTAVSVVGTVGTAVLTGKAAYKSAIATQTLAEQDIYAGPITTKEKLQVMGPYFIPPAVCGACTIGAIVMANRISTKRAAALAASYAISERSLKEYKEKVTEMFGEKKERQVRDKVNEDRVRTSREIIVIGSGDAKFFDTHSGRYFLATMDRVMKAENKINNEIAKHDAASLSEFYDAVGLPATGYSDNVGWNVQNRLELYHTVTEDEHGEPCAAISFVTPPDPEYARHF